MSSILEALKKLEAEKHAQAVPVEAPLPETDYTSGTLLGAIAMPGGERNRLLPVTLLLAGGLFAVLLIGVSVLLALLLLQNRDLTGTRTQTAQAPEAAVAQPDTPVDAVLIETIPEETASPEATADPGAVETPESAPEVQAAPMVTTPVEVAVTAAPVPVRTPPRTSSPAPAPARTEMASLVPESEVRYEPYTPLPEESNSEAPRPLPADIRKLPMPTRSEREQYRIDNLALNMLNEANDLRPTGNAIINLEKVFVGETLPGSNAKLIDVQSHGIAIEIMSTRQRYYIPR